MIIRNFSLSFSHFHFVVVDDWLVSDWRNFFLVPMRAQRSTSKMMCVFACNHMLLFLLHDVVGDKKQKKMAPISLKDPNIQGITEEFVKALTGFKVTCAHIMQKI